MRKKKEFALAEKMYVENGMSAKQIADELSLSPNTVGKWVNDNLWKHTREMLNMSPTELKKQLLSQIQKSLNGQKLDVVPDQLIKLISGLKHIQTQLTPELAHDFLRDYTSFAYTEGLDTEFLAKLAELSKRYLRKVIDSE